jgi:hypothetical protein
VALDQRVVFSRDGRRPVVAHLNQLDALSIKLCKGDALHAAEVSTKVRAGQLVEVRDVSVVLLIREGVHYIHEVA